MMRGYTTNYINLIADNLRDRYENGFPILKELIQNADDAKASKLIFGRHDGFPDASHPLLKGAGLWFFNDGEFKQRDADDLRSFGINSKAGDASVIGKFGLGMKSVFHLCEALFYVACDGTQLHREGLTPWKQDGPSSHPDWDETNDADWHRLTDLGKDLAAGRDDHWFLLWLPLRRKDHLITPSGHESGAIINRFPGDDPSSELAFLGKATLARDVGELLPLLRCLERVEHRGEDNAFVLTLDGAPRLLANPPRARARGQVLCDDRPLLTFSGSRSERQDSDGWFARMKQRPEWPRAWYRDERGRERQAVDKSSAEAAILFCLNRGSQTHSRLQWAVFLPVEDGVETLGADGGALAHSLVLHGQFFLDAGRKRIHDLDRLQEEPAAIGDAQIDDNELRSTWNQRLAQYVLLPLVLPALARYAEQQELSEVECHALTKALSDSQWFKTFRAHICRDASWIRTLQPGTEPRWCLVTRDTKSRLRPVPTPPRSAPERPWEVFSKLPDCNVKPYDVDAPRLGDAPREWQEAELAELLLQVEGLFMRAPAMDYLVDFLDSCAGRSLDTENLQQRLLGLLRNSLRAAGLAASRQFAAKAKRLLGFLKPKRRVGLSSDLPERVLAKLWKIDATVLLVPKGLEAEPPGEAVPDEQTLAGWLRVLDREIDSEQGAQESILDAVKGLLATLPGDARGNFLQGNRTLRIIRIRDARTKNDKPASLEGLDRARETRTLFGFGLGEVAMGFAPLLARAIPDAQVWLVRAATYREILSGNGSREDARLPAASDARACLAAVGRHGDGHLGDLAARQALLEKANDTGEDEDARRGLRLLLHGSLDHREDDTAKLWIGRHDQHAAWDKLWDALHQSDRWSRVPEALAETLPRTRWKPANIAEIDAQTLIDELRTKGRDIKAPEQFSVEEREEILSRIKDKDLWRRLPLHTTLDGDPVAADGKRVYLAPQAERCQDLLTREATLIASSGNFLVAEQQKHWLHPLDHRARIEIALGTAEPACHWRTVMDALVEIGQNAIGADLRTVLRSTTWLPATSGAPVKPEDVIDLHESLDDEVHRLITKHRTVHGPSFTAPAEMNAAVRNHQGWELACRIGFSSGDEGLDRLGLLLEDLPSYHVGEWPDTPEPDELTLLAHCELLSGWRLLKVATNGPFDLETAWAKLGPALSKAIDPRRVADVLHWLSADDSQWVLRKGVFDTYLRQLRTHDTAARDHLPRLRLASVAKRWEQASELCAGARGVVHESLLDAKQEEILGAVVRRAGLNGADDETDALEDLPDAERAGAPGILREYFESWDSNLVPSPMVGVALALLGRDAHELAKEYLHPHSFGWLVEQLGWCSTDQRPQQSAQTLGKTVDRALDLVRARIQVETGNDVEVLNLLGQPIRVALDQEPDTLLVGDLCWQEEALGVSTPMPQVVALTACGTGSNVKGYAVVISLRRIDLGRIPAERLRDLLRSTAEQLYSGLYDQTDADFTALWRVLDRSDQLDIGIARRLILDHVPFYLRQLSVKSDGIEESLAACDSCRRRIAEAEADKQPTEVHRGTLRKALDNLADRIDRSPEERQAVIKAVKDRLEQYQYEPSGIPFELFQNADDAAVELGRVHAHPSENCKVPEAAKHFVVEERDDGLGFLHWGRPINARGPVGFRGDRRGYDRDLEKMLILSASDKHHEEGVTGKFGLGFKSVLLACEQPHILSGRLALRVVSGILPQPWKDAQDARSRLTGFGKDPRLPGTLIDLPGVRDDARDRVLKRFRRLAGILCVFGRAIRTIECAGTSASTWCWRPSESEICTGLEVGDLDLGGDWGSRTRAICVRTLSGNLLMALGPKGFRALPDTVPALWVTAPTLESSPAGFAVNGGFDLDAGRGRLAGNTDTNRKLARRIGIEVGDALGALLQRSRANWSFHRAALGLAADLEDLDFWESIWSGLTKKCLRSMGNDGTDLVQTVALCALAQLSERPHAIPNGLRGSLREFTDASQIRYELSDVLSGEDVGAILSAWTNFTTRYPGSKCVSPEIGNILRQAKLSRPSPVGLPDLTDTLEGSRAAPVDAEVLGRLRLRTEEVSDWKSDDLRQRLDEVLFRSEADQWVNARALLALHGIRLDPDEPRRHTLAPPEHRLHPDYYVETDGEWPAMAFFQLCRQRMEAPAEKISQWMLDAESVESRRHAIKYLADGEFGERVAEIVREKGWLLDALQNATLLEDLTPEQVDRLRRRLASPTQVRSAVDFIEVSPVPPPRSGSPERILREIHQWWHAERQSRSETYAGDVYPDGFSPSDLHISDSGNSTGPDLEDRTAWFTMFALACYQSLGRTQDEQHRGFIGRGISEGWWQGLAQSRPPANVQPWLERLQRWSAPESWEQDFLPWKRTLVDLYTVVRHLDTYIFVFRNLPHIVHERGSVSLKNAHRPTFWPEMAPTGLDAAPLDRSLGIGANWMIRELVRYGVYDSGDAAVMAPYCWATTRRVRQVLKNLDGEMVVESADMDASRSVYEFIKGHIGPSRARFDDDFDLPLQLVTRTAYRDILRQCFENAGSEPPDLDDGDDEGGERLAGEDADE